MNVLLLNIKRFVFNYYVLAGLIQVKYKTYFIMVRIVALNIDS